MNHNNNSNVLAWYDDEKFLNHKKEQTYGDIYPLLGSVFFMLPFQIYLPVLQTVPNFSLKNLETGVETDITTIMNNSGLVYTPVAITGFAKVSFPATSKLVGIDLHEGQYQLILTWGIGSSDEKKYYSEIMTLVNNTKSLLKLMWWNATAINKPNEELLDYPFPYRNFCYIKSVIAKPEYPFLEEAQVREGKKFVELQITDKVNTFSFTAPEYLCDALRFVRLHDYIRIFDNGRVYKVEEILISPKWQEMGDLALVGVEFKTNTIVKKVGTGEIVTNSGSFDLSYNDDFNN